MKNLTIDDLPQAVKDGIITKKQGGNIIWEEIYMNPQKYGLIGFTEDEKSDFLLAYRKYFEELFNKYVPGMIPFKNFVAGCIAQYKMTFLRKEKDKKTAFRTLESFFKTKFEEDSEKYLISVAEDSPVQETQNKSKTFADILAEKNVTNGEKSMRTAKITALILALKACNDIDDETIENISNFTGIDKVFLYEKIQELKDSAERRTFRHQNLIQKRNNAFFFHRKYMQEMTLPSFTTNYYEKIKIKLERQTKMWEKRNQQLSDYSNTPTNSEIARIIGMKARTVSFYVNHARIMENHDIIKNFYNKNKNARKTVNQEQDINDL